MKKSIELTDVSTVVKTAKNLRWLQIATPFALSLVVGAMAGAMLGGMFYGNSIDPASGDFKFVMLRKYHRNHAKTGLDAEAAQYKLSADYLKTLKSVK